MAELDFTWLNTLTPARRETKPATPESRAADEAHNESLAVGEYNSLSVAEKPIWRHQEDERSFKILEDREAARKRDHDRSIQVYREYQSAIRATEEAQGEILKGLRSGADPVGLLLKAVEAIAKMTGNNLFYTQARGDLIAIYGEALMHPQPIQWEIDEAMQRFEKILSAMGQEHDPDVAERIRASAKAHYHKIERLQALLEEAQASQVQ